MVDKGGVREQVCVPKASVAVVNATVIEGVRTGKVWLLSGPASLLAELIPTGVLSPGAKLKAPPSPIPAASILPENMGTAWQGGLTTALAIATAMSQQAETTLPWKTVRDVIDGAIQARFIALTNNSAPWPCDLSAANTVKIKVADTSAASTGAGAGTSEVRSAPANVRVAAAEFGPSQMQDLGDLIPALLAVKARAKVGIKFHVRLELGDGTTPPNDGAVNEINSLLKALGDDFRVV